MRYQPTRAIAFKQGDPPPSHIARSCDVIFEGGAAKAPNVVQKDGTYTSARLIASKLKGYAHDEHTWVWFKESQLGHYSTERLQHAVTREADITKHIKNMASLKRPIPARVDLINEPLSPSPKEFLKTHPLLIDQVTSREIAYYFRVARWYMPEPYYIVNEWGCERDQRRADNLVRLLRELGHRGGAPDGVGLQCHLKAGDDLVVLDDLLTTLAGDFPIYFTEIDIEADEEEQVRIAKLLMAIVRRHKVRQICLWHWRDKGHWKPGAAPFDYDGNPKRWAKILGYA